jgi:hypothetical protein
MNKKAFELSINFIVILIISIVIFGFGIKFVSNLMQGVNDLNKLTNSDFEANMERILCDSSEKTCVGISRKEIRPNKVAFFTFGVLNTNEQITDFYIDIEQAEPYDNHPDEIKYQLNNELTLDPFEQNNVVIAVQVPGGTKKGTYVLNVYVCSEQSSCEEGSNNRYSKTKKLYIEVP